MFIEVYYTSAQGWKTEINSASIFRFLVFEFNFLFSLNFPLDEEFRAENSLPWSQYCQSGIFGQKMLNSFELENFRN